MQIASLCCRKLAAMLAAFLYLASSDIAWAGITDGVRVSKLPNGLTVLVLENHKAPVATFNVFYKVGSRNERSGRTGLSHLLEHLMFRGTKKLKPEEFSNIIQENGGRDNAFTTEDFTGYFEIINKDHLDVPISLEADRMANFDPKGFESERAVVAEERRLRTEDDPDSALGELIEAQAYVEHPYHWPVIGWMRDIQALTLDDALRYHSVFYSPRNAIIVAVGDFDSNKVLKEIAEQFGGINSRPEPPRVSEIEPPQQGERRVVLHHAADLPAFGEVFHVPNWKSTDHFALEVLADILAAGKSSRLYRKLVLEKRMVVTVDTSYDPHSFDATLFWISAKVRPKVKTEDVIAEVDREVKRLRDSAVAAEELQKAKNGEQASFVFGQDSVLEEAMMIGTYQMLGDYRMLDQYLSGIEKVSAADVQRVARQYLVDSNRTVGILLPTGTLPHPSPGGGQVGGPVRHAGGGAGR